MNKPKETNRGLKGLLCGAVMAIAAAVQAQSPTIDILGTTPPVPGPADQYQTNMPAGANQPPGLNYYFDNGNAPSQTFTTGDAPSGYTLTSVAIYDAGNSAGSLGAQTFTLYIYDLSGTNATTQDSFISQTVTIPDSTWFVWTNLGTTVLLPNTQYAWSMHRNNSGWANVGNVPGDRYPAGQVASIPVGGGGMIFSTTAGYDATFDVGLSPITLPVIGQATFSPYSVTLPGSSVTASAPVTGPGPYRFQWQTDGGSGGALTNIPGATSSNLVINTTGFAIGNYQYLLVVSNNTSSASGSVGVLTVQSPIGIPGVIAVKFGFTNGYATSDAPWPADNAGVATGQLVPPSYQPLTAVGNWDNLLASIPSGADSPTKQAAINQPWNITSDTAGNALPGVTLTPAGFDDGWYSGGTECADGRLLYDFWKLDTANGMSGAVTWPYNYATLTFANLPASTYDVYVYVNDNNGNYWGNVEANSVFAVGNSFDLTPYGFNGADSDPCDASPQLHTAAGFGNPANYVRMPYVATNYGGTITITVAFDDRANDFGVPAVELVPSQDLTLVQDILPTYAETVAGDQVVFTAAFSNSPAVNVQWQQVNGGVTNNVNTGVVNALNDGVITSTLTLANVQLGNAGSYQLKAVNAANSADYSYSAAAQLVVNTAPSSTNGVVIFEDAQIGLNFYPPWTIVTNSDLIFQFPVGGSPSPGTAVAGSGNFGLDGCAGDPSILSDGTLLNTKATMVSCGPNGGAGASMTYYLQTNSSPLGFEVTNIEVFGGWTDAGRRNEDYTVSYATLSYPTNFIDLAVVDYVPADSSGAQIATRTMLLSTNGVLAHNVIAVQINWTSPSDLNGYAGYSEISINGTNSTRVGLPAPLLLQDIVPQTAADVVGSQVILTAGFTNYTSLQWQVNGTNIAGATSPTLALNNLQLANGGSYVLVASNSVGTKASGACALTVNPVPAPVDNVIVSMAAQTENPAIDPVFSPAWNSNLLASSLLYNVAPDSSGAGDPTGSFDGSGDGASPATILTDGSFGQVDTAVTLAHTSFSLFGSDTRAGNFVYYIIPNSTNGYTITNITVYGGWNDGGRDGQAYTISYSTVENTNLVPLASVNYLPANPNGYYSMTRATITPAGGVLAANVTSLYFDFTTPTAPGGENGFEGYSEIAVYGTASAPAAVAPKIASITRSGSSFIVTGTGGYPPSSGYTWLSTTNLTPPVIWITNSTGTLDANGAFTNSVPINPSQPETFFRLRLP